MDQNKLSNNEELVLRLLYSKQLDSASIPQLFFGLAEKENLIRLNLIELTGGKQYVLTPKAIESIETGGFIVKYPLHDEHGVVMNFVDILQSYSKEALRALGLSIINTKSHKRWGRYNNVTLFKALKETLQYYESFEHPLSRIDNYHNEVLEAQSIYEKVLITEMTKIGPFTLTKPLILGTSATGDTMYLLNFINLNEGVMQCGPLVQPIDLNVPQYKLTAHMMYQLIRQYYVAKSKAVTKPAIVEQK